MKIDLSLDEQLEVIVLGRGAAEYTNDFNLRISIIYSDSTFTQEVWIEGLNLENFLKEVQSLKMNLRGEAMLRSESPDEFELLIKAVDTVGHFVLKIELGKQFLIGNEWCWTKRLEAFSLESSELIKICEGLEQILQN